MNLKKLLSILFLVVLLLNATPAYTMMTSSNKEELYHAGINDLETYLESSGNDSSALVGILSIFDELGGYEQSKFLAYYVSALIKFAGEEYDYELYTILDIVSANGLFVSYLDDLRRSSPIGTVDELKIYASAREDEHKGNYDKARNGYLQCIGFFDSAERYSRLPNPVPQIYETAIEMLQQGNFAGAYFGFADANRYGDSVEMMASIVNQLGYTPESPTDNLLPVTNLSIVSVAETSITLSWDTANHAKSYEVYYKPQNQSNWILAGETEYTSMTIHGLTSGGKYNFKVVSAIGRIKAQEVVLSGQTVLINTATPVPIPTPVPAPTQPPTRSFRVGDIIKFGRYPQTNSGNDRTPIEWIVLDIDKSNNRVLLISRYLLEPIAFSNKYPSTWENSSLRSWLNGSFLNSAFSYDEQQAIIEITVDNSKIQGNSTWNVDGGRNTKDKIFILSYAEASKYFGFSGQGKCILTDYTKRRGHEYCLISDTERVNGSATGWWWLRSPGMDQSTAMCMCDNGSNRSYGITNNRICVRPALWVNLSAGVF